MRSCYVHVHIIYAVVGTFITTRSTSLLSTLFLRKLIHTLYLCGNGEKVQIQQTGIQSSLVGGGGEEGRSTGKIHNTTIRYTSSNRRVTAGLSLPTFHRLQDKKRFCAASDDKKRGEND